MFYARFFLAWISPRLLFLSQRGVITRSARITNEILTPDLDLFGTCPSDNAVCVAIKFRNPKASQNCQAGPLCDDVGTRLTTTLGPGTDSKFPQGCSRCVELDGGDKSQHWAFDVILPYDKASGSLPSNEDTTKTLVYPMVDRAFACETQGQGCQGSAFFAYGATGSGKSYTMGFNDEFQESPGLMQLGMDQVYTRLQTLKTKHNPLGNQRVFMVFYELYGTEATLGSGVIDLLKKKKEKALRGSRESVLRKLTFFEVPDMSSLAKVFKQGMSNRQVGATGMNLVSSRSHAVVQFFLTDTDLVAASKANNQGKLAAALASSVVITYVDLAGSEKPNWEDRKRWPNLKDDVRKLRTQEGKVINMGLTMLATCISKAAGVNVVCSTRTDMLTEMLKGLFEKDRKTGRASIFVRMIATVNPSADPEQVTLTEGTMRYASIVKKIKIALPKGVQSVKTDELNPQEIIKMLKARLADLEEEAKKLKQEEDASQGLISELSATNMIQRSQVKSLQEEIQDCEQAVEAAKDITLENQGEAIVDDYEDIDIEDVTAPNAADKLGANQTVVRAGWRGGEKEVELACKYSQQSLELLDTTTGAAIAELAAIFEEVDQATQAEVEREQLLVKLEEEQNQAQNTKDSWWGWFSDTLVKNVVGDHYENNINTTIKWIKTERDRMASVTTVNQQRIVKSMETLMTNVHDVANAALQKDGKVHISVQFANLMKEAAHAIKIVRDQAESGDATSGSHAALESMLQEMFCNAYTQMLNRAGGQCKDESIGQNGCA